MLLLQRCGGVWSACLLATHAIIFPFPRLWVSYVRRAPLSRKNWSPWVCPHDRSLTSRLNTVTPHQIYLTRPSCLASRRFLSRSLVRPTQTTQERAKIEQHELRILAKDQILAERNIESIPQTWWSYVLPDSSSACGSYSSLSNNPQTDRLLRSNNSNLPPAPRSPPAQRLQRLSAHKHRPDHPRLDPRRHPRLVHNSGRSGIEAKITSPLIITFATTLPPPLTPPLEQRPRPPP